MLNELENDIRQESEESEIQPINLPAIKVRLANYEPVTQLKNLKANFYGKQ